MSSTSQLIRKATKAARRARQVVRPSKRTSNDDEFVLVNVNDHSDIPCTVMPPRMNDDGKVSTIHTLIENTKLYILPNPILPATEDEEWLVVKNPSESKLPAPPIDNFDEVQPHASSSCLSQVNQHSTLSKQELHSVSPSTIDCPVPPPKEIPPPTVSLSPSTIDRPVPPPKEIPSPTISLQSSPTIRSRPLPTPPCIKVAEQPPSRPRCPQHLPAPANSVISEPSPLPLPPSVIEQIDDFLEELLAEEGASGKGTLPSTSSFTPTNPLRIRKKNPKIVESPPIPPCDPSQLPIPTIVVYLSGQCPIRPLQIRKKILSDCPVHSD